MPPEPAAPGLGAPPGAFPPPSTSVGAVGRGECVVDELEDTDWLAEPDAEPDALPDVEPD